MRDITELDKQTEEALSALTAKQAMFVREYLLSLNATDAARKAGYSEKTAASIGHENLTKPDIRKAIDLAMGRRAEKIETSAQWVVQELAKNHHEAKDRKEYAQSNRALELIGKHHKAFTDRVEVFDPERLNDDEVETRLAELEAQIAEAEAGEAGPAESEEAAPGTKERTETD